MDGDTIEVLDVSKNPCRIHLVGIDVPEKAPPFGNAVVADSKLTS
jgi:endonuclease YncB( thermonuclease family)